MHSVSVLALDGVLAFDLATPLEVFGRARMPDGRVAYTVRVCAPHDEVDAGAFGLRTTNGLNTLAGADTVIVPGLADPTAPVSDDVLEALRAAAPRSGPPGAQAAWRLTPKPSKHRLTVSHGLPT